MAYWLYCQVCNQWSKFATPLSDDKSCTFCNSQYKKCKQLYHSNLDNEIIEKLKNFPNEAAKTTTEMSTDDDAVKVIKTRETFDVPEEAAVESTTKLLEAPETGEIPKESEISGTQESLSSPDEQVNPATPQKSLEPAPDETLEESDPFSKQNSQEISQEPINNKANNEPEASTSDDTAEDSEQYGSPVQEQAVTSKITEPLVPDLSLKETESSLPNETEVPESPSVKITISHNLEPKETDALPKTTEAPQLPEASEDPVDKETTETADEIQSDESPQELQESITQELSETTETIETDEGTDALDSDQITEDSETYEEQEEPEFSERRNTPAHRMFIEDRRRRRKQR